MSVMSTKGVFYIHVDKAQMIWPDDRCLLIRGLFVIVKSCSIIKQRNVTHLSDFAPSTYAESGEIEYT